MKLYVMRHGPAEDHAESGVGRRSRAHRFRPRARAGGRRTLIAARRGAAAHRHEPPRARRADRRDRRPRHQAGRPRGRRRGAARRWRPGATASQLAHGWLPKGGSA